jgi:hypothetical protein
VSDVVHEASWLHPAWVQHDLGFGHSDSLVAVIQRCVHGNLLEAWLNHELGLVVEHRADSGLWCYGLWGKADGPAVNTREWAMLLAQGMVKS